jgi:hypothetical protein
MRYPEAPNSRSYLSGVAPLVWRPSWPHLPARPSARYRATLSSIIVYNTLFWPASLLRYVIRQLSNCSSPSLENEIALD